MHGAMDGLTHRRVTMRHDDGLTFIAAHFDHAALVTVARLVADFIAEVDVNSPDAIRKPLQCFQYEDFDLIRELFASLKIAVCSDLDQHSLRLVARNSFRVT